MTKFLNLNLGISIIFLAIFIADANFTRADFMQLHAVCEDSYCVDGRYTNWNLSISNKGQKNIQLLGFRIIDAISQREIASVENEYPIIIESSYDLALRSKIPSPNQDKKFIAVICLINRPPQESWAQAGKRIEHCYNEFNFSFPITSCLEDSDCADDSICEEKECKKLECSYCQYAKAHACYDHECCNNLECQKNQQCTDNKCVGIKCPEGQYTINHSCTQDACLPNETVENFSCVPLACEFDESISNHSCIKLNCSHDEKMINQGCEPLNCSYDQAIENHACTDLSCKDTEGYDDHNCVSLSCGILKVAQGHECRFNSLLIIHAFLLFVLFFLLFLNIEKMIYVRRKKLVEFLMAKKKGENIKTGEGVTVKDGHSRDPDAAAGKQSKAADAGKKV